MKKKQKSKTIEVLGVNIKIDDDKDYISLTDIARQSTQKPKTVIQSWMKNHNTIRFLWYWEELHNPNFKGSHMTAFIGKALENSYNFTPSKWIKEYNAIGLRSSRGRFGGGTFAHNDIALEFCSWLSPKFKVYLLKEFQRLKSEEAKQKNLKWHLWRITNNIDDIRNLLDTIPYQDPKLRRIKGNQEEE